MQLAWPREWGPARPPGKLILVIAAFGLAGIVLIGPFASDFLGRGDQLTGVLGLVGGLTASTMAVSLLPAARVRRDSLPRLSVASVAAHGRGLRIDVRASWRPLMAIWLLLGAGFLALRGAIAVGDYSTTDDPVLLGMNAGGIVLVTVVLVATAVVLASMVFGRHKHFFALTEDGVVKAAGRSISTIAWDDIDRISPVMYANVHAVRITPRPWVKVDVEGGGFGRDELETSITVLAWHLKIDPPLLLRLVRFYARYPELRSELASDVVIDRMRRADFRKPKNLQEDNSGDGTAGPAPLRFRSARGLDPSPATDS